MEENLNEIYIWIEEGIIGVDSRIEEDQMSSSII